MKLLGRRQTFLGPRPYVRIIHIKIQYFNVFGYNIQYSQKQVNLKKMVYSFNGIRSANISLDMLPSIHKLLAMM